MLHFRDLRAGTLDLAGVQADALASLIERGRIRLSQLFVDPETFADAARRARAISAKAREMYEEKGVVTLHLARDLVSWNQTQGASPPAAPILLTPISLTSRSFGGADFELAVEGPTVINPVLLHALRTEFRIAIDESAFDARRTPEGELDTVAVHEQLHSVAQEITGFAIASRIVVSNFSYAKLPMVLDLEAARTSGALANHDIIAAVAGDAAARDRIRARNVQVEPALPDHQAPGDEFCVLDADASQSHAINTVIAGEHLIIKGPPGTGKSQTISNLIATMCARGQRVLFVAEKRAAIDAVTKRLVQNGLGDLVLDVHGGVLAKRTLAQQLAASLQAAGSTPLPNVDALHAALERERTALNRYSIALHERRAPNGASVHDLIGELVELAADRRSIRLPASALVALDQAARTKAVDDMQAFVELGGLAIETTSPWAGASISNEHEARAALDAARAVGGAAPSVADIDRVVESTGQRPPSTVQEWFRLATRLDELEAILEWAKPTVFEADLISVRAGLAPAGRNAVGRALAVLSNGAYRAAKRTMRAQCRDGATRARTLAERANTLAEFAEAWAANGSEPRPSLPDGDRFPGLAAVVTGATELGARLPRFDIATVSPGDLVARGAALAAETGALAKLPELHQRRESLTTFGFGPLLDALVSDGVTDVGRAVGSLRATIADSQLDEIRLAEPTIGTFDGRVHDRHLSDFRQADAAHIGATAARVQRAVAERIVRALDEHPEQAEIVQREAAKKSRHLPFRDLFAAAPDVLTAVKPCWAMSPLVVSQLLPTIPGLFDLVVFDEASQITPADAMPAILRGTQLVVTGDDRQLPPTAFFSTTADALDDDSPDAEGDLSLTSGFESVLDALTPLVGTRLRTLLWHYRSRDERLIAFSNAHFYDRSLTTFPGALSGDVIEHVLVGETATVAGDFDSSSAEVRRVVDLVLDHARRRPRETLGVIAMGIKHANRVEAALHDALRDTTDTALIDFFSDSHDEPFFVKNLERVQGDERDAIILTVGYGKDENGKLPYRFGPLLMEGGERRLNVAVTRAKRRMTLVSSFSALDMDPNRSNKPGVALLRAYLEYAAARGADLGAASTTVPALNAFEISVRDALVSAGVPVASQYGASGFRIDFAAMHPDRPGQPVLAIECDGASYHAQPTARARDRLRQDQLERLGWRFHRIWSTAWFASPDAELARAVDAWRTATAAFPTDPPTSPPGAPAEPARPIPTNAVTGVVHPAGLDATTPTPRPAITPATPAIAVPPTPPTPQAAAVGRAESAVFEPQRGLRPRIGRRESIDDYRDDELLALLLWIRSDTLLRTEDHLVDELIDELGFARRGRRIVERLTTLIRNNPAR